MKPELATEAPCGPVGAAPAVTREATRRVARNIGALAGGQAVTWGMTLLWTMVVPRVLGPVQLGLVVSAVSVSSVLGLLLGLGTRNYLVREIVVNPDQGPKLIGTAIVLRVILMPLTAVGAVVFAHLAHYGHERSTILYLAVAMTVLTLLAEPMQAAFQAMERMQYLAYADIVNKTAQSVIGIALVLVGFRAVGTVANMAIIAGVVAVLLGSWLRRFMRVDLSTNIRLMRTVARQSVSYWVFGLFCMIYLWIDTIMLSLMTPARVVGWYGAPMRLFQTLMFLPMMLSTAWLPRLVEAHKESPDRLLAATRKPLELVLVLSTPIAGAMAMTAGPLVYVIYGSAFTHAIPVTVILALCIPPMYVNIMLGTVLLAAKRQVTWTYVMAGASVVNPIFNLVLIPFTQHHYGNGAIGAALSLLLTEGVMVVGGAVMLGRHVFARSAVRRAALAALAAAGMWGAAFVARPLGQMESVILGLLVLAVLTVVLRIATDEEIEMLRRGLARLRRRRG
jgi:O-antigen/teichoic acid export membrane protein